MRCLVTALQAESEPLIQHFELERYPSTNFPFFLNKNLDIGLIKTGVGKKNIRSRIEYFSKLFYGEEVQYINIGIAGGSEERTTIGDIYLINSIEDEVSGSIFFPDILVKHDFKENSIITVDSPVTGGSQNYMSLVDMESSEVFRICSKKTPLHNIAFLKIVSDYMNSFTNSLKHNDIYNFLSGRLYEIDNFLDQFNKIKNINKPILNKFELDWICFVKKTLLITKTQENQLAIKLKKYRLKYPKEPIPAFEIIKQKDKEARNRTFFKICDRLAA